MRKSILMTTFRRMFTSSRLYIAVALSVFLYFLMLFATCDRFNYFEWDVITAFLGGVEAIDFLSLLHLGVVPAFAFAGAYAEDQIQGMVCFWSIRGGCRKYAIAQFATAVVGGFLVAFVSQWLLIGILSTFMPMLREYQGNFGGNGFADGLINHPDRPRVLVYLLVQTSQYALSAAMFSAFAAWIGSLIPDRLVVYASTVVLYFTCYYALYLIPAFVRLPYSWYPGLTLWLLSMSEIDGQWLTTYLLKLVMALILFVLLGFFAQQNIVRRQRHE